MTLIKDLAAKAKTVRPSEIEVKVKLYSASLDLDVESKKLTGRINLLLASALTDRVKRDGLEVHPRIYLIKLVPILFRNFSVEFYAALESTNEF